MALLNPSPLPKKSTPESMPTTISTSHKIFQSKLSLSLSVGRRDRWFTSAHRHSWSQFTQSVHYKGYSEIRHRKRDPIYLRQGPKCWILVFLTEMQSNSLPFPLTPFILFNAGELSEGGFELSRVLFLGSLLFSQGEGMDLSKVGEKILSSVRSARSLGLLPSSSDRPEVVICKWSFLPLFVCVYEGYTPYVLWFFWRMFTSNYLCICRFYSFKSWTTECNS